MNIASTGTICGSVGGFSPRVALTVRYRFHPDVYVVRPSSFFFLFQLHHGVILITIEWDFIVKLHASHDHV